MTLERREILFFGGSRGHIVLSEREVLIFDKYCDRGFKWRRFSDVKISEVAEIFTERVISDSFTIKIEFEVLKRVETTNNDLCRGVYFRVTKDEVILGSFRCSGEFEYGSF